MPSLHLLIGTAVATLALAVPLSSRDSSDDNPFVGPGIVNVVAGTKTVGCLTNAGQFTTATTACGAFNGTVVDTCTEWGCSGDYYYLTTPSGTCAAIFQKGSQYEEGGNGVLSCSPAGVNSDKNAFTVTGGVNDQIGMTLLEDSNGAASFNTIQGKPASATPQDLQDDLGEGAEVGTAYALTWTST